MDTDQLTALASDIKAFAFLAGMDDEALNEQGKPYVTSPGLSGEHLMAVVVEFAKHELYRIRDDATAARKAGESASATVKAKEMGFEPPSGEPVWESPTGRFYTPDKCPEHPDKDLREFSDRNNIDHWAKCSAKTGQGPKDFCKFRPRLLDPAA